MTPNRQTAIDTLTAAARAVAAMPEHERAGWLCYLAEGVEALTPDANPHSWLADAVEAMQERLTDGQW